MKKLVFALLLGPLVCLGQGDWDNITIKSTQLTNNIYYLEGRGGNIGVLVGEEGVLLVDNQFARLTEKIKAAVKELTDAPINFIVNTHYHGDHMGGNENFKKEDAVIMAHANVKERLSITFTDEIRDRTTEARPESFWPTVSFPMNKVGLEFFNEDFDLVHLPNCHTDGDMLVHFKNGNVIHTGDTFVRYGYPFIDVAAGGSIDGFIAAQEKILELADANTKIIPGHGQISTIEDVKELLEMLKGVRKIVADAKDSGVELEDLIPQKPLADYHERWNGSFINSDLFVQLVYESLD